MNGNGNGHGGSELGDYDDDDEEDEDDEDGGMGGYDDDLDDLPVTGFAVASAKRNHDFHLLFKEVPEVDYLIEGKSTFLGLQRREGRSREGGEARLVFRSS